MVVEWLSPALTAYKHRDEIGDLLSGGLSFMLGKKTSIAITGMQGAGKTVLVDFLSGKAFQPGYVLPLQSQKLESAKIRSGGKRIRLSIVPGQRATPRFDSLEVLFESRRSLHGVIHVVANGFEPIYTHGAMEALIRENRIDTIGKIRKHQMEMEIADLDETCSAIRRAHRKHHQPRWLILAVDKVDLYHDSLPKVRGYYSPEAKNPFSERLNLLTKQVGSDYFRWDAVPVCASLEKFAWHKQEAQTQIDANFRNAYVAQLLRVIESYCE